ncbi:MAG: HAMP domain-containing histidine kinase [Sandaracinaceae bacterium]|nr:HAMP domain-containing histidine kinase [Sandaracinaceae bacterium]
MSYRVGLALSAARAYAAAESARERAERAARGRDRVLSAVTHDLRAPLATVHLGASLLADAEHADEAYGDIVNRIVRATGRMRRLVEDLLDLGQLESGVLRVQRARVKLGALLADTADELAERARAAQKELACAPPAEPVEVIGDHQRLAQVLVNLIVNAIDHTPPGTWIVIGGEVCGDFARVWVEDDGPGIASELVEHLFEPHVRGSRATSHGAGLGLWIAKAIAVAHGSDLQVISAPDQGTRFEMRLALAAPEP